MDNTKNNNQTMEIWQPTTLLKSEYLHRMHFKEILRHNDYFKITLEDNYGNQVDVIYEDPDEVCPLEYYVWSFRYGSEMELRFVDIPVDKSNLIDQNAGFFFKMNNSNYIKEFDTNHIANRELFPNVEHHLYLTGDEVLEVISNYEPRIVERKKM